MSLRRRVILLATSIVVMVVAVLAVAEYAVVRSVGQRAVDNELHSKAQLLIESGRLEADPGKAIEGVAGSDVSAMYIVPGRTIYAANQQGQALPVGQAEKDVIAGKQPLSLRTGAHQRVLAERTRNGGTLLLSKTLSDNETMLRWLGAALLMTGCVGVAIAAAGGAMVTSPRHSDTRR